jgi:hypothetical protein
MREGQVRIYLFQGVPPQASVHLSSKSEMHRSSQGFLIKLFSCALKSLCMAGRGKRDELSHAASAGPRAYERRASLRD